jgi:hypothetical protein
MKLRTARFRCDLCGQFHMVGITETAPKSLDDDGGVPGTSTSVCVSCIAKAGTIVAEAAEDAWARLRQAGFGAKG